MQKSFNWLEIVCPLNEAVTSGEKWRARFSHTCSAAAFLKIFASMGSKPIKLWVLEYFLCIFIRRFFCVPLLTSIHPFIFTLSLLDFAHRSVSIFRLFSFFFSFTSIRFIVCALCTGTPFLCLFLPSTLFDVARIHWRYIVIIDWMRRLNNFDDRKRHTCFPPFAIR